ncbi:MAG: hypothetical protein KQI81_08835 [Deltaproteobacteria bacterium]|nr:hypothetical protein [Deltaproteobacteria bacterium]
MLVNEILFAVKDTENPMSFIYQFSDTIFTAENCSYILKNALVSMRSNHLSETHLKRVVRNEVHRQMMIVTPAVLYRRWMGILREFGEKYLIREISLRQTLPYSELDSPTWVDAYTGEVLEDEFLMQGVNIKNIEIDETAPGFAYFKEHGWTIDVFRAYSKAQGDFNHDDDPEEFEDDFDVKKWSYAEMQNDNLPTEDLMITAPELRPFIKDFHDRVNSEFAPIEDRTIAEFRDIAAKAANDPKILIPSLGKIRANEYVRIKRNIDQSWQKKELLDKMQELLHIYTPADVLQPVLHLIHDYGILESDLRGLTISQNVDTAELELMEYYSAALDVDGYHTQRGNNLYEWYEIYGPELEYWRNDKSPTWTEVDMRTLDKFNEQTLSLYTKQLSDPKSEDIKKQPTYVKQVLQGLFTDQDITSAKLDQQAWYSWLEEQDIEGMRAYKRAIAAGKSRSDAWKAFVKLYSRYDIVAVNPKGIRLKSPNPKAYVPERLVPFKEFKSLITSNLVRFNEEIKAKLIDSLKKNELGVELVNAL